MKAVNKLLITLFLAFSFNAMASFKIESVKLNDNSLLKVNEISKAFLLEDNSVDYIELIDGSKVEGFEIKNISFSEKFETRIQTRGAVRTGGDGSGG